jgi:membrane-associated phospholipid phosphatase
MAFKNYKYVFVTLVFLFLSVLVCLLLWDKEMLFLGVNSISNPFLDVVFYILTWFGDGFFALIVILLLALLRFRYAILVSLVYFSSGIIVQVMKQFIFPSVMRPVKYFDTLGVELNLVDAVNHHSFMSFPSGHSATAFSLFVIFALLVTNRFLSALFVLLAAIIAFSRVYLAQHFVLDVFVGSAIGTFCAIGFYYWQTKWKANWLDYSVIKLFRK